MANQGPPSYTALEPTALKDLGVDAPTFQGNDTSFLSASTFVYTLILVACIGAAFYKFTVAGIVRMEASEANIRKSNEMFKRASLGLLGVFGLFLLLFTINKDLVMGDIDLSGLRSGESRVSSQPSEQGGGSARDTPPIPKNNDDPVGWGAIKDDPRVRTWMKSIGISVNRTVCTVPTQTSCTTVGSLPQETLQMLLSLRKDCPNATIEVTGGTEAGHSSHGPGKYPVDLSKNKPGNLNECIASFSKSSKVPTRSNGAPLCFLGKVFENYGYIFCDEAGSDPHWHVYKG